MFEKAQSAAKEYGHRIVGEYIGFWLQKYPGVTGLEISVVYESDDQGGVDPWFSAKVGIEDHEISAQELGDDLCDELYRMRDLARLLWPYDTISYSGEVVYSHKR
jgi:hypothetical protein